MKKKKTSAFYNLAPGLRAGPSKNGVFLQGKFFISGNNGIILNCFDKGEAMTMNIIFLVVKKTTLV